jgi:hypothetical protein
MAWSAKRGTKATAWHGSRCPLTRTRTCGGIESSQRCSDAHPSVNKWRPNQETAANVIRYSASSFFWEPAALAPPGLASRRSPPQSTPSLLLFQAASSLPRRDTGHKGHMPGVSSRGRNVALRVSQTPGRALRIAEQPLCSAREVPPAWMRSGASD